MELRRRNVVIWIALAFLLSACSSETASGPPAADAPQPEAVAATLTTVPVPVAPTQPKSRPTSIANQGPCVPSPSSEQIPSEIARNTNLWRLPNRDYASARATFDSNISADTIDRLEVVWTFKLPPKTNWGAATIQG